jgi:uncharacterized repeat protein (TIGR03803 family)
MKFLRYWAAIGLSTALVLVCLGARYSSAQDEVVLHKFHLGTDGGDPTGSLIADSLGNLYGATDAGGGGNCTYNGFPSGCGTVYELTSSPGGGWSESVIYAFQGGSDGQFPFYGLVFDQAGNLYGVTTLGGLGGGTVFELSPPTQSGGSWVESVLYRFTGGSDGSYPRCALVLDQAGNLYGTTNDQGAGYGTVFEVSPPVSGGSWSEKTLHTFDPQRHTDGAYPIAGLVFDKSGNLYGTTGAGGSKGCNDNDGCGTVFQLRPPKSPNGVWIENIVYIFEGSADGAYPSGNLILEKGTLLGTAVEGGLYGMGTVFQIIPTDGGAIENTLYSFQGGDDGETPDAGLIADASSDLYGTTFEGGGCISDPYGCGTVFLLSPPQLPSETWTEKVLYAFQGGDDGQGPDGNVLLTSGWLVGVTVQGGGNQACDTNGIKGCGEVFAIRK